MTTTWWTIERHAELTILLKAGLSMGAAAVRMHISRNSVIGRVHRSKDLMALIQSPVPRKVVVAGNSTPRRPAAVVPATPPKPLPLPPTPAPTVVLTEPTAVNVTMNDIRHDQCRFPVAEDHDVVGHFLLCGTPVAYAGGTYCPYHTNLCITCTLAQDRRRH